MKLTALKGFLRCLVIISCCYHRHLPPIAHFHHVSAAATPSGAAHEAGRSSGRINIALHAQVSPSEKVVGSAITTEGMRAAFSKRRDVKTVEIFYPFHYSTFLSTPWHLVLVEGWFPSIHSFIAVTRASNPGVIVLFYCLDPEYPGMPMVYKLDVDGFLTNSKHLLPALSRWRPAVYVPLAADVEVMKPDPSVRREYGAVYVGAGGNMLRVKPLLREMLHRSVSFGLRLHGSHWEQDELLGGTYQGVLPPGALPQAYSSAHAVLAHTITSQREMGMINNRIFEALACGNVVISDFSDVLNETFGEVLQFVHQGEDVEKVLQALLDTSREAHFQRLRVRGRDLVVGRHSWAHRAVEILDIFHLLRAKQSLGSDRHKEVLLHSHRQWPQDFPIATLYDTTDTSLSTSSIPRIAWVVSEDVKTHVDYLLSVHASLENFFLEKYIIDEFTAAQWMHTLQSARVSESARHFMSRYSLVISIMSHLDELHLAIMHFQRWQSDATNNRAIVVRHEYLNATIDGEEDASLKHKDYDRVLQKYIGYIIGVDEVHSLQKLNEMLGAGGDNRGVYLLELFDVVLFRDDFEKQLISRVETESYTPVLDYHCQGVEQHNYYSDFVIDKLKESGFENRSCDFPLLAERARKVRWHVCFGVWDTSSSLASVQRAEDENEDEDEDEVSDEYVDSPFYDVAICVFNQKSFCTTQQRSKVIPPRLSLNYTLLLLGGSLSEWINYCDNETVSRGGDVEGPIRDVSTSCVIESFPLENLIHVRHVNSRIVSEVLLQAREIFYLYHENINTSSADEGDASSVRRNSKSDVVWPFLFGAAHKKALRLSLQPLAHLSHLLKISAWFSSPLSRQWTDALSVSFSFGSYKASAELISNYINPSEVSGGDRMTPSLSSLELFNKDNILIYVNFHNFISGLDGQACFFHDGVFSTCRFSRDLYLLDIDLHKLQADARGIDSKSAYIRKVTTIRIELRGFLYLEYFYVIERSYVFCVSNPEYLVENSEVSDSSTTHMNFSRCANGTENKSFNYKMFQKYVVSGVAKA